MTDNVDVTPGSGKTVGSTDVGGVQFQRIIVSNPTTGAGQDLSEGASLNDILTELQTPATSIPHFATDTTSDLTHGFVTSSSSGEQDMVAAVSGQTTRIYRFTITAAAATVVELRDGASGTALKTIEFPAAGAYVYDFDPRPYCKTTANTKLVRNSTVATKVTIDFGYLTSA